MSSAALARLALFFIQILKEEKSLGKIVLALLAPFLVFVLLIAAVFEFVTTPALWLPGENYSYISEQLEVGYAGNETITDNDNISFVGNLRMPCDTTKINSDYGLRVHPIDKKIKKHTGIDFGTAWHSNIYAVADGKVVSVKTAGAFGRNITLEHELEGKIIYSFYAHLSQSNVKPGDNVNVGDIIALEGGQPGKDDFVGKSTGHHLHFEIRTNPSYLSDVDPKKYLGGFDKP